MIPLCLQFCSSSRSRPMRSLKNLKLLAEPVQVRSSELLPKNNSNFYCISLKCLCEIKYLCRKMNPYKNVAKLIFGNATFKKWQPRQHENVSPNNIREKYLIALN